jgi:hypothetical protein
MEDITGVLTFLLGGGCNQVVCCVFYVGSDMRSIEKLNVRMEGQF